MKKFISSLLFLLFIVYAPRTLAIDEFIGAVYWSSDCIKVLWDSVPNVDDYEVKLVWVDHDSEFEYFVGTTTQNYININRPRTGHFKVMVRSHIQKDGVDYYSRWSDSSKAEDSLVGSEHMGWLIFFKTPPVTGINISKFGGKCYGKDR